MDLDGLLRDAGGFGRFQVIDLAIMFIGKFFSGWSMFQMTFSGIVPDFICKESASGQDLSLYTFSGNLTTNGCSVPLNTSDLAMGETECVTYNYTSPYKTVMKDFNLVCGRGWIKPALASIQMAGLGLGGLVGGQMGDSFGRWWSNLIFVVLHSLANIAAAFAPSWEIFAVCRFVIGAGIGGIFIVSFIHPMEFLPKKWRPVVVAYPAFAIGIAVFALSAYVLQDWRKLHLLCGACGLLEVPFLFLLPESFRWLATQGRIDQAVTTINKVARWNGRPEVAHARETLEGVFQEQTKAQESSQKYTYIATVRNWPTAKITLVMCYHWFCYSLAYYGISFGVSDLAGNFFVNVLMLGLIDVPAMMTSLYLINKFGRKWSAFPLILLALGCAVTCMALQITGSSGNKSIAITILSLTAKMMVNTCWGVIQTWGNELYPTVIRNLGYGAANTTARVSGILAPLIINFESRMTFSYVLIGALLAMDLVCILLLPETKGRALPDTITDVKFSNKIEPLRRRPEQENKV